MFKIKLIKIPKHTTIIYDSKKKFIVFIGPVRTKTLKLQLKLKIIKGLNLIGVTTDTFKKLSNNESKKIKALQGTTEALIKKYLIETTYTIYEKLKLVGVGYRVFPVSDFESKLLMFKLGYSHPLYYKIPEALQIISLKFTKLFIYGTSYQKVSQISSLIRSCKLPEPYKGKGILYDNEKIILKEGKKV
jgi:large subunit ribosomal protein L6